MKWIKIQNRENARAELPLDRQFFALWKGHVSLAQYDEEDDCFYVCFSPAEYESPWKISPERENKFEYWAEATTPEDW